MDYDILRLFFSHGITFKEVSGESGKVTKEMAAPWDETTLPTILARYQLKDIFNADEFGLFYEALSSKSLHFRGRRCSSGKHSKVRLTGITASNTLSEKIPIFATGESTSPRCFKHVRNLPCRYWSQKKAWMNEHFLRNGCTSSIVSSKCKKERLLWQSIKSYWKLSIYSFYRQIPLPVYSRWIRG